MADHDDDPLAIQRAAALQTANTVLARQRRESEALHARLQDSEDRFRQLSDHCSEGFWFVELEPERLIYVNPAMERIFGQPAEFFYREPRAWLECVHPADRARVTAAWERVARSEAPRFEQEYRVVWPDGTTRWVHDSGTALRNEAGQVRRVSGIAQDVTERKQLEAEFRQAQKMDSVGRLAGGIAHDFNNLLTVITGVSELAMQSLPQNDPLRADIEEIARAGQHGATLTRQLLAFSRKQTLQPTVIDLNRVVADLMVLLLRIVNEDIQLTFTPASEPTHVCADHGQLEQVLMNLVVNARDAMPHGGTVAIEASHVFVDHAFARQHGVVLPHSRPFIKVSVQDSGVGMDEATKAQIFEPFFTTKAVGEGTGLGLSTVYGIVKQSGGYIFAESAVGRGTRFDIYLPRVDAPADTVGPGPVAAATPSGAGTVLVVEDNIALGKLTKRILDKAGYRVLTAASGPEALRVLAAHSERIDLLLTDVIMPGMNGYDLATQVVARLPDVKVIYTSGYTADVIGENGLLEHDTLFVSKPFTAKQLLDAVRRALDGEVTS